MATNTEAEGEAKPEQQTRTDQSDALPAPEHGSTGEGAGSALARLIRQEQSRVVPAPDEPADSSC